jgi:hypothetical protein
MSHCLCGADLELDMTPRMLIVAASLAIFAPAAEARDVTFADRWAEATSSKPTVPATQGRAQPQGPTGPLETKSGGAPAESPQGETPPGMQSAPEGSSTTTKEPPK